jgi:hypothetical protein
VDGDFRFIRMEKEVLNFMKFTGNCHLLVSLSRNGDLWDSKRKRLKEYKSDHLNVLQRKEAIAEMEMDRQLGLV